VNFCLASIPAVGPGCQLPAAGGLGGQRAFGTSRSLEQVLVKSGHSASGLPTGDPDTRMVSGVHFRNHLIRRLGRDSAPGERRMPPPKCATAWLMSATGSSSDLAGKAAGGRRLIAIVYADMVGYSRLIGLDDAGTLRRLRTLRRALIDPAIREHGGKVVQTGGDS
jgi:class 3 adenylate cyclase